MSLFIVSIPVTVYREERLNRNVCHDLGQGSAINIRVQAKDARDALQQARLALEQITEKENKEG